MIVVFLSEKISNEFFKKVTLLDLKLYLESIIAEVSPSEKNFSSFLK